ncbi:arginine deiminase-related protein [Crenobacter sp. SG2303]|uniref:Arginine deiminase-related protein n=1 Tax=Crenobacter oryzisoli TaxID=3056844 RepID=A0ABT7XIZ1_9NEIS|nr:arginine deiminase-related protein [Crenobacter sp. SG2303]MDN0073762.1 arginine deiminase-related protein [Crenobacter sp. SG2303]
MYFTHAITRLPADTVASGLTTANAGAPDAELTRAQFRDYVDILLSLGLTVTTLPAQPDYPDAHFVEDTAVLMPELAVITNPGAPSRRGEVESIAPVISRFRHTVWMGEGAHMDGGDVLMVDKRFFIGLTSRTNEAGIREFATAVEKFGYTVSAVEVGAGLHLKSIVNYVGRNTLILSEDSVDNPVFKGFNQIVLNPEEEYAGNTLWINDTLITPTGYPDTLKKLKTLGLPIIETDTSEIRKMDGGLTCMSLRF